jgi:hypothetical protein
MYGGVCYGQIVVKQHLPHLPASAAHHVAVTTRHARIKLSGRTGILSSSHFVAERRDGGADSMLCLTVHSRYPSPRKGNYDSFLSHPQSRTPAHKVETTGASVCVLSGAGACNNPPVLLAGEPWNLTHSRGAVGRNHSRRNTKREWIDGGCSNPCSPPVLARPRGVKERWPRPAWAGKRGETLPPSPNPTKNGRGTSHGFLSTSSIN